MSSTAPRDTRRKSGLRYERELGAATQDYSILPRRAVWLKQNCGVNRGASGVRDMTAIGGCIARLAGSSPAGGVGATGTVFQNARMSVAPSIVYSNG